MAERVGFEPTKLSLAAFQERYLQPLGHLSASDYNICYYVVRGEVPKWLKGTVC